MARQFGPLRDSSSVIKKYPDFTYSKGWTVYLQFRQVNFGLRPICSGAVLTCDRTKESTKWCGFLCHLALYFIIGMEITGSHYFKRAEVTMAAANILRPIVLSRFVLNVICPLVG